LIKNKNFFASVPESDCRRPRRHAVTYCSVLLLFFFISRKPSLILYKDICNVKRLMPEYRIWHSNESIKCSTDYRVRSAFGSRLLP